MTNPAHSFVSAQDLIDALRSEDPQTRQKAIDATFPGESVLMISASMARTSVSTTTKLDPQAMFTATLFVQMQVAKMLGIDLHWIPSGERNDKKLIVAPPGSFQ
jgi:hypothetical protein